MIRRIHLWTDDDRHSHFEKGTSLSNIPERC
jgi:hypothetical protein